jgi:hypothetical protein
LLIWFNEEVRVKGLALSYMKEERAYEQKALFKYNTSRLNLVSYTSLKEIFLYYDIN